MDEDDDDSEEIRASSDVINWKGRGFGNWRLSIDLPVCGSLPLDRSPPVSC